MIVKMDGKVLEPTATAYLNLPVDIVQTAFLQFPSVESVTSPIHDWIYTHLYDGVIAPIQALAAFPGIENFVLVIAVAAGSAYLKYRLSRKKNVDSEKWGWVIDRVSYLLGGVIFLDVFMDMGHWVIRVFDHL